MHILAILKIHEMYYSYILEFDSSKTKQPIAFGGTAPMQTPLNSEIHYWIYPQKWCFITRPKVPTSDITLHFINSNQLVPFIWYSNRLIQQVPPLMNSHELQFSNSQLYT